MEKRILGNTKLEVSVICLGTMTWGEQNSEKEAHEQMDMAMEHGVNFFDTAELYPVPPKAETQGRTEDYIGSWLSKQNRSDIIIANKVSGPGMPYFRDGSTLTASHIEQAVERSLNRLQTNTIDLYQLHWPQRKTNYFSTLGYDASSDEDEKIYQNSQATLEESLIALDKLVQAGKIRYIGLSNETAWGISECLRLSREKQLPRIVTVQNPYNLLNRSYEVGAAEFHQREQVGLLAYSPLAFGVLTGKYLKDPNAPELKNARLTKYSRFGRYTHKRATEATRAYAEIAKEFKLTLTQMSLAYINQKSFVTANIIGATTLAQLKENLQSVEVTLKKECLAKIEELHKTYTYPCP